MFARGRVLNAVGLGKLHLQPRVLPSPSNFARKYSSPIFGNSRGNIPTGRYNIGTYIAKRRRERERWEKERESWQQLEGGDPYNFDSRPPNVVDETLRYKIAWERAREKHRRIVAVINGEVPLPHMAARPAASDVGNESAASGRPADVATVSDSADLQSVSFEELMKREKTAQAQPLIPDDIRRALLAAPLRSHVRTMKDLAQRRLPPGAYDKYFAQFFPNDPIYEPVRRGLTIRERKTVRQQEGKIDVNFFVVKRISEAPGGPPREKLAQATELRVVGSHKKLQLVLDMIRHRTYDYAYLHVLLRERSTGGAARTVKELLEKARHNAVVRKGLDGNRLELYRVLWGRKTPIRGITYHSKGRAGQRNTDVSMVRIVLREISEEDFVLRYGPYGKELWEGQWLEKRLGILPQLMAQRRDWLQQRAALRKGLADHGWPVDP